MSADEFKHDPKAEEWVDPYPKKKNWIGWIVTPIVALAIYLLSVGPVVVLMDKKVIPKQVEIIYEPLIRLCVEFPPAERITKWYLDVWENMSQPSTHP
jgi:hypothetical protein